MDLISELSDQSNNLLNGSTVASLSEHGQSVDERKIGRVLSKGFEFIGYFFKISRLYLNKHGGFSTEASKKLESGVTSVDGVLILLLSGVESGRFSINESGLFLNFTI